jgi:hypothetical protein
VPERLEERDGRARIAQLPDGGLGHAARRVVTARPDGAAGRRDRDHRERLR